MTSVVIWGSGAIGGTIGAYLARAGNDVLFVDTEPDHVERIRDGKLCIEGPIDAFQIGGAAATPQEITGKHRLIILAVKAHHTEAAARELVPFLADDGAVASFQNGLNEIIIADIVGRERTIGAFVNFMADFQEPGRILYGGRGAVVIGELDGRTTDRIVHLHELIKVFEPEAVLTGNIFGYIWGKQAYGTLLKASAVADEKIVDFIEKPAYRATIIGLIREMLSVADKAGIRPLGFNGFDPAAFRAGDEEAMAGSLARLADYNRKGSAKAYSGIWRDIVVRKRQSDATAQLAPVQDLASKLGLTTPLIDRLVETIKTAERQEQPVGPRLFGELRRVAEAGT